MVFRQILACLLVMLLAGSAVAGTLSPNMEAYLDAKADGEPVMALLMMNDRLDIKALDWELHEAGVSFDERHFTVITALQQDAQRAQASFLRELDILAQLGEIDSFESYWIVNGVFIIAKDEEVIRDLALRADVDMVEPPLTIELIEPVQREALDKSVDGIGITPGVVNVGARRVWDELGINGTGALVANLDTGVDGSHPALASRWRGNYAPAEECWLDFVGGFNNPPVDSDSHGTHTMGTMCGTAPGDTVGVAPGAHWIAANTIVGGNLGNQVLQTMQWLADPDGNPATTDDVPDVANNSWGVNENFGYPDCFSGWWDAIDACEAAGVMHVWATGNEGPGASTVRSPGDRATTIYDSFSVGSTSHSPPFSISYSSSRGPAGPSCGPAENLIKPEVSAPGNSVYSSVPGSGYSYFSGTSMATPHVAGVVALMRSANPDLDVITIKQILMNTADDLGTPGEDNSYGWGFLDAYEAVSTAIDGDGVVVGRVVDDVTGDPVVGARVEVLDSNASDVTDELGGFWLTLPGGTVDVVVSAFGYADLYDSLDIPAGSEIQPVLNLIPLSSVTLSGTVYLPGDVPPGGTPAVGATVKVTGTPLAAVTTGSDGTWSIDTPQATEYIVKANLPTVGSVVQTLPAGTDRDCSLYLRATVEEGFETGDFSSFPWIFAGNADWEVTTDDAFEGTYSTRSGTIFGTSSSILYLDIDLPEAGQVSFWYKNQVNSGSFSFWDGFSTIETFPATGTWTYYSYEATAGTHTFRWRVSTSSGGGSGDVALVDLIKFPGGEPSAPRAVPCPDALTIEVEVGGTATAELLVLNQGVEDLIWTLSDAAPYLGLDVSGSTLPPAGYEIVTLSADANGLAEGNHQFDLALTSNDPANGTLNVPVTLVVGHSTSAVGSLPEAFALTGVVPNPFNPQTAIHFTLPQTQTVYLRVYDVQGHLVRELVDGVKPAGPNQVNWDGRDGSGRSVASGTYFARLESGGLTSVKSMVLVR
jgi:subtilisin family serine protease